MRRAPWARWPRRETRRESPRAESSGMARRPPEAGRLTFLVDTPLGSWIPSREERLMARIALIKLFTGLNLGVSQLSGELQRAGHDTIIVYFKDYLMVPRAEVSRYRVTDYALTV